MQKTLLAVLSVLCALILAFVLAGCKSKSTGTGDLQARSDSLTSQAVADMLGGSEDYAAIQDRLIEAVAFNRNNVDARLMLGVVVLMRKTQEQLRLGSQGDMLLQRAGLMNGASNGQLWNFRLQLENHGQGLFKDTTPTLGELKSYFDGTIRPAIDAVLAVIDTVPSDWQYVIPAQNGGMLLQRLAPGQQFDLRLDYGDVQLAAAAGHAALAVADLLSGFNANDLAPNDFDFVDNPNLDALEILRTQYPDFGRLVNPPALVTARNRFAVAWQHYLNGSTWMRGENAEQQGQGLVTLGREAFGDPTQTQTFLMLEERLRTQVQRVVDGSFQDVDVLFDIDPLTGLPLPIEDQAAINFFRFYVGIDLRDLYFETVVDPLTNRRALGVGSLAELTPAMANFQGVVASIGGVMPRQGDLQELIYSLRVDNPPISTKVIDGNFSDWQSSTVQVGDTPAAWIDQPAPELGSHYVAVDNNYLYLYCDTDLTPFLFGTGDRYQFEVATMNQSQAVRYEFGLGHQASASTGALPTFAHNAQGIEMRFPLAALTGDWVAVRRSTHADNTGYAFGSDPQPVFVKIR